MSATTTGYRHYRIVQGPDPMQAVPLTDEESPLGQRRARGMQDWMTRLEAEMQEEPPPILEPVENPTALPLETNLPVPTLAMPGDTIRCPHCHHPVAVPVDENHAASLAQLEREHRQFRFLLEQVIDPQAWNEGAKLLARIRAALGIIRPGVPAHAE